MNKSLEILFAKMTQSELLPFTISGALVGVMYGAIAGSNSIPYIGQFVFMLVLGIVGSLVGYAIGLAKLPKPPIEPPKTVQPVQTGPTQ